MRHGFLPRKILERTFDPLRPPESPFAAPPPPAPTNEVSSCLRRIQYVDCVPLRVLKLVRRFDRGVLRLWNTNLAQKERRVYVSLFFSDLILASWISKSSSLPFLNRIDANNSQFRLTLLPNDVNTSLEFDSHQKEIESEATANMKRIHSLTSAQKRALIVKRLIPLVMSLMILGGSVTVRFLIPMPSSHGISSFGNDTLTSNTTSRNLTTVVNIHI